MSDVRDDLSAVRSALALAGLTYAEEHFARVEAELARLTEERDRLRDRLTVEQADHDAWADAEEQRDAYRVQSEAQASEAAKWRKRAEAAEAELARLQDGLRQIAALADNATSHYDDLGMADLARALLAGATH